MQRLMMRVELFLQRLQSRRELHTRALYRFDRRRGLGDRLDLVTHPPDDSLAIRVHVRDHHQPPAESLSLETLANDVQRRLFLTDDEHAAPPPHDVRHHVDDRLALAGARRPFDDQPGRIACLEYRGLLRRITVAGEVAFDLWNR